MSFLHPQLLWLLLIPAFLLVAAFMRRDRAASTAHPKIARASVGPAGLNFKFAAPTTARPITAALAIAAIVLALARPQGGEISAPGLVRARDVLIAVDVSRSMLAADLAPNRLDRARLLVRNLADELRGERLGLLPFAGSAFLQSPLSADYEIFRTFLDELGPDMIPAGGSDFTSLLTVAGEAFGLSAETPASDADRYLVILSDGEAQDETWRPVAEKLAKHGVRIIALGLGSAEGSLVPAAGGGVVKDERGAAVLSRLNPATLRELARIGGGTYRDASTWIDLPELLRETVARGHAGLVETERSGRRVEYFTWFLLPALLFATWSLVREFPAPLRPRRIARAGAVALAIGAALPGPSDLRAESTDAAPDPLVQMIEKLAAADAIAPVELAKLADITATRGEASPLPEGALRDALAAVRQGKAAAPAAADWAKLNERLEALLAPPPKPDTPPKPDNQKSQTPEKSDEQKSPGSEQPPSQDQPKPSPQNKPESSQPESSGSGQSEPSQPDQNPGSGSQNHPDSKAGQNSPGGQPSQPEASRPMSETLGNMGEKTPPDDSGQPPPTASRPAPQPPEPQQQAGGVSASGRAGDDTATQTVDPSLRVPMERLEGVRAEDSPARLYQLMQEAELTPDARERRAASGPTRDW